MKKHWFMIVGAAVFVSLILVVCPHGIIAQESTAEEPAASAEPAVESAAEQTLKPVYIFKNAEEMEQFKQLVATKQVINTRIAVLNQYLAMERNNLDQVDVQLYLKYNFYMETGKRYDLNEASMTLREVVE